MVHVNLADPLNFYKTFFSPLYVPYMTLICEHIPVLFSLSGIIIIITNVYFYDRIPRKCL